MFTPFSIVYGSYSDNIELDGDISKISQLYNSLTEIQYINYSNNDFFILPTYIEDIDTDNFTLKDAFGNEIDSVTGYFNENNVLVESNITFPANKNDYPDFYSLKGFVAYAKIPNNKQLKIIPIFKNKEQYCVFDKILLNRMELFLNYLFGCVYSTLDDKITEIGDGYIKVGETAFNVDNDLICVNVDDIVNKGDLLEKNFSFSKHEGIIVLSYKKDFTFPINMVLPFEKIKIVKE